MRSVRLIYTGTFIIMFGFRYFKVVLQFVIGIIPENTGRKKFFDMILMFLFADESRT